MKKTDTGVATYEIELASLKNEWEIINADKFGKDVIKIRSVLSDSGFLSSYPRYEITTYKNEGNIKYTTKEDIAPHELSDKFPGAVFVRTINVMEKELTDKCKEK